MLSAYTGALISLKALLFDTWQAELSTRLSAAQVAQSSARSGTRVDGSHRPANRGERGAVTAQGYLALGLGQRVADLTEQLRLMEEMGAGPRDALVVGALAEITISGGPSKLVAIVPGGDGTWLEVDTDSGPKKIQALSAASPLIRQLRECGPGDLEDVELGDRVVEVTILQVY